MALRALIALIPAFLAAQAIARKSLSIGVHLPHAYYSTEPASYFHDVTVDSADPHSVANAFLRDLLSPDVSYVIRSDSYTDATTGITHIYASQRVGGLAVADGNINLNIRHGVVLSHGNSFYSGPQLSSPDAASSTFDPYLAFCDNLHTRLYGALAAQNSYAAYQVHLGQQHISEEARVLSERIGTYCAHAETASSAFQDLTPSAETALLHFLVAATADPSLSQSILNNPVQYLHELEVNALQDSGSYTISGVPGVIDDVIASLVYVQVPDDAGNITLVLAHRFEVRLPLNSYEAYISFDSPHRILSVVDYAHDGDPHTDIVENDGYVLSPSSSKLSVVQQEDLLAPIPQDPLPSLVPSSYRVFKWGFNDPDDALRKSGVLLDEHLSVLSHSYDEVRTLEKETFESTSSPVGWHTLPECMVPYSADLCDGTIKKWRTTDTTYGNNVFVQEDWEETGAWWKHKRPTGARSSLAENHGGGLVFDYPYKPVAYEEKTDKVKEVRSYLDASATQAFYLANMVHDLFYRYGFDEPAGNFQQWNFRRGGEENDAIVVNIQKSKDKFNWGFMDTPKDGGKARCDLHVYNQSTPYRDSAMSSGVLVHELTHGLTSRLAGGPNVPGCMGLGESKGMSEGWSDYVATLVRATDPQADYVTGDWVLNTKGGARKFPFTLDFKKNPTTYENASDYAGTVDVDHDIGTIWAEMLWTATAILSDKHGFSDSLFPPARLPDGSIPSTAFEGPNSFYHPRTVNPNTGSLNPPVPRHGNTLMLQLMINGLKLMKCPVPDFLHGRDTIIEADQYLTNGANKCELWMAFAQRGLGVDAKVVIKGLLADELERTNGFKVPNECKKATK